MVSLPSESASSASFQSNVLRMIDSARQEWLRTLITLVAVLAIGWLVLYPLGILFKMGFSDAEGSVTLAN
jgi:hypothetical protein